MTGLPSPSELLVPLIIAINANGGQLNHKEIEILEKLINEIYLEVEPTRLKHPDGTLYTDDEMFEANANYEFTVTVGREIQAEIIAMGRPSPAKLLNAMSNPQTLESLMQIGLVPQGTVLLTQNDVTPLITNTNITTSTNITITLEPQKNAKLKKLTKTT